MNRRPIGATLVLPPAAFIWTALVTAASPWNLIYAIVFGIVAIPLGRWVDSENHRHHRP